MSIRNVANACSLTTEQTIKQVDLLLKKWIDKIVSGMTAIESHNRDVSSLSELIIFCIFLFNLNKLLDKSMIQLYDICHQDKHFSINYQSSDGLRWSRSPHLFTTSI